MGLPSSGPSYSLLKSLIIIYHIPRFRAWYVDDHLVVVLLFIPQQKLLLSNQDATMSAANETEQFKTRIRKVGDAVIYDFLKVYNNPIEKDLDYFQVVPILCDILRQVSLFLMVIL